MKIYNSQNETNPYRPRIKSKLPIFLVIAVLLMISGSFVLPLSMRDKTKIGSGQPITEQDEIIEIAETIIQIPEPVEPEPEPEPEPKRQMLPEMAALIKEYGNDDIIGYLKIEGTTIDYPVVQAEDNSYYLEHDINRNEDKAGWVFMDYENDIEYDDWNTIIYAHNMREDYMFHGLRNFKDKSFFDNHRFITFDSLYEKQTWEIFSFMFTDVDFYYIQVFFDSKEQYANLLKEIKTRSVYNTGVEVTEDDRILCLSTCSNITKNTRYVVCAKLVETE